jgi:hypothetical protein
MFPTSLALNQLFMTFNKFSLPRFFPDAGRLTYAWV